jgi:hypothetical protein
MSEKITYSEYLELARNPETEDDVLLSYSRIQRGRGGFDFIIKPDPNKVEMTEVDTEFENAMQIGNGLARFRRQMRFARRKLFGSDLPVLVSEGDSWFQFPLLIREIIDHLDDDYLVWSVGAAGDTAENIVYGHAEYLEALEKQKNDVRGFLFSAAGNDIIGEDPKTGRAALLDLLIDFNGDPNDIEGHIDMAVLAEKMEFLKGAYIKVVEDVRATPGFDNLPIFIHGYDYPFPYPWGEDDPRHPIYADKNQWLGKPLDQRQIHDHEQRRNIIKYLIDRLYLMLEEISADSNETGVWLVNFRGAMPEVHDWNDEIHGTTDGFFKVTTRLLRVLSEVIG